ncbi:MAG: radical SAM protein [Elusimicrobia bacterium]|nr:radical SAM protein [Elusimicrobiota bacterium]
MNPAERREQRLKNPPHKVFFDWEIIHSCSYKCDYCWFTQAGWDKFTPASSLPSLEGALRAWERMHELYGSCHINITGGEPSEFPRFFELLERLARLHTLEVQTNLNFPPEQLIGRVPPERLRLAATFHPAQSSAELFIYRARHLRKAGFDVYCNFLAHPEQLDLLPGLRRQFAEAELPFYVQRYDGQHEGRAYPAAYAEEQLAVIEDREPDFAAKPVASAAPRTPAPGKKETLCRMGQMYAKILPDGKAFRCRTVAYEKDVKPPFYLGNIFADEAFALHETPLPCALECRCDPMPVGGEDAWLARARENSRTAVTLAWDLCYDCNYRCPYCKGWDRQKNAVARTPAQWRAVWERLHELYGTCHVYVSGGEPSIHPDFAALMLETANLHQIDICTNFSWEPEILTAKLSPSRLTISATFHPDFADFGQFLAKAVRAKAYLANGKIYTVASPKHMDKLEERAKACAAHGIKLQVMPLRGTGALPYAPSGEDVRPPEPAKDANQGLRVLNTPEQKRAIAKLAPAPASELRHRMGEESPKGKPCRAGFRYAIIRASGKVDRCSQCETGELGDIFDPGFRLLDGPKPCPREFCPIESSWLA